MGISTSGMRVLCVALRHMAGGEIWVLRSSMGPNMYMHRGPFFPSASLGEELSPDGPYGRSDIWSRSVAAFRDDSPPLLD